MKIIVIALFFISFFPFTSSPQVVIRQEKKLNIFCDNFPRIQIDSINTDTTGLKKYINDKLIGIKNDSITFIIACPDNIALQSVILTENMLRKHVNLYQNKESAIFIYNKCTTEFSLPWVNKTLIDLSIRVDINAQLSLENKPISIEALCEKYEGQDVTIEIIADTKLTIDKFSEIFQRLNEERFKIILAQ